MPRRGLKRKQTLTLLSVTAVVTSGLVGAVSAAVAHRQSTPPLRGALRVLARAHVADAPVLRESLPGATTITFSREGPAGDDVFVATMDSGAVCVVDQEPLGTAGAPPTDATGLIAVGCGEPSEVQTTGIGLGSPASADVPAKITVLVPNDVTVVNFQSTTGVVTSQPVQSNVAQYEADDLASASYATPRGTVEVHVPVRSGS
jgi:hypothetical protein